MESTVALFKDAASFIDNEVAETIVSGGRGAGLFATSVNSDLMVFSGPVMFNGNRGLVSEDSLQLLQCAVDSLAGASFMLRTLNTVGNASVEQTVARGKISSPAPVNLRAITKTSC